MAIICMFVVYKLLHPYVLKNGPPRWQHLGQSKIST